MNASKLSAASPLVCYLFLMTLGWTGWSVSLHAASTVDKARQILDTHCVKCHGNEKANAQLNVLDIGAMVDQGYLLPGNPEDSYLWQKVVEREMPPPSHTRMTDSEVDSLRSWIEQGAQPPVSVHRDHIDNAFIVELIYQDLMTLEPEDRPFIRYFSLANLHNNIEEVSDKDLRLYRAALSKLINSLSHRPRIYVPKQIDSYGALFRLDMRAVGWATSQWDSLLTRYPYGYTLQYGDDRGTAGLETQIAQMTGALLSWVRADWFVASASRAPLYDELLQLPSTLDDLEDSLDVNVATNFRDNVLQRAGLTDSGVSKGHRIVERHDSRDGYYWKSFDFREGGVQRNVIVNPLGPKQQENPFDRFAFVHDGSELIFSLPNGLQAYLLVDAKGDRIQTAPIEIVRDENETSGTPQVVNGVSCIRCHRTGIIPFRDIVRDNSRLRGPGLVKLRKLYPKAAEMNVLIERDRTTYLRALNKAIGSFLLVGQDASMSIEDFEEPVGKLVKFYDQNLSTVRIAHELGIPPQVLRSGAIRLPIGVGNPGGLAKVNRKSWESTDDYLSEFQQALQQNRLATPLVTVDPNLVYFDKPFQTQIDTLTEQVATYFQSIFQHDLTILPVRVPPQFLGHTAEDFTDMFRKGFTTQEIQLRSDSKVTLQVSCRFDVDGLQDQLAARLIGEVHNDHEGDVLFQFSRRLSFTALKDFPEDYAEVGSSEKEAEPLAESGVEIKPVSAKQKPKAAAIVAPSKPNAIVSAPQVPEISAVPKSIGQATAGTVTPPAKPSKNPSVESPVQDEPVAFGKPKRIGAPKRDGESGPLTFGKPRRLRTN